MSDNAESQGGDSLLTRFPGPRFVVTLLCMVPCGAKVSPRAEVECSDDLRLGKNAQIGSFSKIKSSGSIGIGRDCLIGPHFRVISNQYRYHRIDGSTREPRSDSRGARIGDNVLLGAGVIVAPHSVVSTRIPDDAIFRGDPAAVVFIRR